MSREDPQAITAIDHQKDRSGQRDSARRLPTCEMFSLLMKGSMSFAHLVSG